MAVVEQIGPSTTEFARARKLSRQVGDEMLAALKELTKDRDGDVRSLVIMVGLDTLNGLRKRTQLLFPDDVKSSDLLMELVMLGYGWSAMATFYDLTIDYTKMLDELNGMKVQDDNDLPPTEEKG